jgi:beta-alanine--pyruvate transaminase
MQYGSNDLAHHWLPFTANKHFKAEPRLVVKAEGVHYTSHHGHEVLDGVSGLFCCPAGHGRREIAEAVFRQMQELDYTPHFQHAFPGSFELARRVALLTPGDLDYVFFGNSGSEAVETAMKIALLYHRVRGQGQRQRLVGREKGYHGVNFAGFSLGGMVRNRDSFGLGLPGVLHLRHTWLPENRFARGRPEHGVELADDLQRFCDLHGPDTIAAVIVEPVAGSVGCLAPPVGYLERLREICDRHGILLVFDEVICGFGRLGGANFGAQRFGVTPDMITMAKALTNGCIPMGAVAVSEGIYKEITEAAPERAIELYHGYTYSAHPAACAAGIAALEVYERDGLLERAKALEPVFLDALFDLRDLPIVTDIRGIGLLGAIDLAPLDRPGVRGYQAVQDLYAAGLLTKVTADSVLVAPPFVAEESHLHRMRDILREVLSRY